MTQQEIVREVGVRLGVIVGEGVAFYVGEAGSFCSQLCGKRHSVPKFLLIITVVIPGLYHALLMDTPQG